MSKKLITKILFLTSFISPLALAKVKPLHFDKTHQNTEQSVTGSFLYLNDENGDLDLLIQDDNRFSYYPHFNKIGLADKARIILIPDNAQFYNQAKLANNANEVIVYLTRDSVMSYNIEDKTLTKLLAVDSLYKYQADLDVSLGEFVQDFNQDGLSDFITYSLDATHVYLQNSDGTFAHQPFAISPRIEKSESGILFTPQNFYQADFNNDEMKDIAFQEDDQLKVFTQKEDHSFNDKAIAVTLNAHLDRASSAIKKRQGKNKTEVELVTIEDINGDGLVEIITKETVADGKRSKKKVLMIRYGFISNGLMSYKKEADDRATLKGIGKVIFGDIDSDGFKDYLTITFSNGIGTLMGVMSGSFDMDVGIYKLGKNGKYSKKPIYENEIEIEFNPNAKQSSRPLIQLSDFNGDDIDDLLIKTDDDEFTIYAGTNGKRLFAKRGVDYNLVLPIGGRTLVKDFNNDGKSDILFLYGKYYDKDEGKELGENKLSLWLSAS